MKTLEDGFKLEDEFNQYTSWSTSYHTCQSKLHGLLKYRIEEDFETKRTSKGGGLETKRTSKRKHLQVKNAST